MREVEPWREDAGGETWRRLEAHFPASLDTHSPRQIFYYDADLRLRRHDYTAEVVGGWARAAHMCADHVEAGGLVFPTRRWVRPIGPQATGRCRCRPWSLCNSPRSRSMTR